MNGKWEVVKGLPIDAFSQAKIDAIINEFKEERDAVKDHPGLNGNISLLILTHDECLT